MAKESELFCKMIEMIKLGLDFNVNFSILFKILPFFRNSIKPYSCCSNGIS